MNIVSFPGLGIDRITLNPKIEITESFSIRWYAVIIVLGILAAYVVCSRLLKSFGIKENDLLDCILYGIPIGFIGARLTYVLGDLESFDSFMDVISVWNGGLAIYGGIIFAAITIIVVCKIKKCSFGSMLDIFAIGLLIGQMIGRWGNFVNVEVYGVATSLPWAMHINGSETGVHPLFMYEILWNLVGFILIFGYRKLRKFDGEIFLWYLAWYGLGRGLMEPMRNPEFNLRLFGVRIMMVLAFAMCIASVATVIVFRVKKLGKLTGPITEETQPLEENYDRQFEEAFEPDEDEVADEETEEENDEDN
ncbi:MAG: prolipoprotein diacylglyceryl transferase [Clostridia bacterium]|nr:prolipoprotein diacylglyceryl transferase [Clostridia bacterium]